MEKFKNPLRQIHADEITLARLERLGAPGARRSPEIAGDRVIARDRKDKRTDFHEAGQLCCRQKFPGSLFSSGNHLCDQRNGGECSHHSEGPSGGAALVFVHAAGNQQSDSDTKSHPRSCNKPDLRCGKCALEHVITSLLRDVPNTETTYFGCLGPSICSQDKMRPFDFPNHIAR